MYRIAKCWRFAIQVCVKLSLKQKKKERDETIKGYVADRLWPLVKLIFFIFLCPKSVCLETPNTLPNATLLMMAFQAVYFL